MLVRFHERRGLLLSRALAYNVLLSIVPLAGVYLLLPGIRLRVRDAVVVSAVVMI